MSAESSHSHRVPYEISALFQPLQCRPLLVEALPAFLGEPRDAGDDRILVEVRFGNHIRLESAREPLIVPVGRERVIVGL